MWWGVGVIGYVSVWVCCAAALAVYSAKNNGETEEPKLWNWTMGLIFGAFWPIVFLALPAWWRVRHGR